MCVKTRSSHLNSATSRYAAARSIRVRHSSALTSLWRLRISRGSAFMFVSCFLSWTLVDNRFAQTHDAVTSETKYEHPRSYNARADQHRIGLVVFQTLATAAQRHPVASRRPPIERRRDAVGARPTGRG